MAKTTIKLSELPETTTDDGVKVYGATSYETQIAILSFEDEMRGTLFLR